ncbi:MAG: DAK2 domain-containing protein [Anaerolineae bacterium]
MTTMEANATTGPDQGTREPILQCDGQDLIRLTQAGLAWLQANHEHVNSLNVFPVPDGDTGTNMLLTMRSAWREIEGLDDTHIGRVAGRIYYGALMGARGNSGVILSQLWRGFARGVEREAVLTAASFARGLREASHTAYSAVQEPVEGTMLTVAREAAEEAATAAESSADLRYVLQRVVERCHLSVRRTPELLPVLKEAGVVDSGGMGFTYIVEGMLRYINGEHIALETAEEVSTGSNMGAQVTEEELAFPYDVQFLIKGQGLDVLAIRHDIEAMGDSGVIVGDDSLVKVHIHVVDPGVPISYGAARGQLLDVVVENMQAQYHEFATGANSQPAEMAEVEPPAITPGSVAVVTVAPGRGFRNIFYSLGAGAVIEGGQTMNPSTAQIMEAVSSLPTDKVIILPNNKNIHMAAAAAAAQVPGKDVRMIPTSTIPQGIAALLALDSHGDMDAVVEAMTESSTLVETGEVTTATRNAKVNGVKVRKGQAIGLHNDVLKVAGDSVPEVTLKLLEAMGAADLELITVYYGEDVSQAEAEAMVATLQETYPDHEIELRYGGQAHYYYVLSVE